MKYLGSFCRSYARDAIKRAKRSSRGVNILPKPIVPKPPKAVTHARSAVTVTVARWYAQERVELQALTV